MKFLSSIKARILYQPHCESTNDAIHDLWGPEDVLWVWSMDQRSGRGSRGRSWRSPANAGLAVSAGFTSPPFPNPRSFCYPLFSGVVLCDALTDLGVRSGLRLKWPNDIWLFDRKLAGILSESRWLGEQVRIILGFGINWRDHPHFKDLPHEYAFVEEINSAVNPNTLVHALDNHFQRQIGTLSEPCLLCEAWLQRSGMKNGDRLVATWDGQTRKVIFRELLENGSLCVEDHAGHRRVFNQSQTEFSILGWESITAD